MTRHDSIISEGLLILGFSAFDAFVGLLLTQLYREQTTLIHTADEKSIQVSELLQCDSIQNALDRITERDIASLLRDSYDDLFSTLAIRYGVELKKFASWPVFVESAQRRNLVTHCNGVVNSQYINACKKANYQLAPNVVSGKKLEVGAEYLKASLDVLYEVGVKLGMTLWKKTCPDKTELVEAYLAEESYALLVREEWQLAVTLGEFAVNQPKQKSDVQNKIARINYAQALKWSGKPDKALQVLDGVDWSGSIRDLRLGVEALRGNYNNAATLMRQIGKVGEMVGREGYRNWPVFREFRRTPEFQAAFKEIFGIDFAPSTPGSSGGAQTAEKANESAAEPAKQITHSNNGDNAMPSGRADELFDQNASDSKSADSGDSEHRSATESL